MMTHKQRILKVMRGEMVDVIKADAYAVDAASSVDIIKRLLN